jgi:hypothetical protein
VTGPLPDDLLKAASGWRIVVGHDPAGVVWVMVGMDYLAYPVVSIDLTNDEATTLSQMLYIEATAVDRPIPPA